MQAAADAWLALRLFAIDPALLGGAVLHAAAGPVRDRWLAAARRLLGPGVPWRTAPTHVDADRLLGGLDLAATLARGRAIGQRGLLAEAHGGVLMLPMAERAAAMTIAHVASALDRHVVEIAKDGIEASEPARFGVIALDESVEGDAALSPALGDRLALRVDLDRVSVRDVEAIEAAAPIVFGDIDAARARLPAVSCSDAIVEALCQAALAFGVDSLRAGMHALRVARLVAAAGGRDEVEAEHAAAAARLVLAPRATRLPPSQEAEPTPDEAPDETPESSEPQQADSPMRDAANEDEPPADEREPAPVQSAPALDEVIVAAAEAAIPPGLLLRLQAELAHERGRGAAGRAGAMRAGDRHGRPADVRRASPRGGARLDLIATLRAAAPWQRLRRAAASHAAATATATASIGVRAESASAAGLAPATPRILVRVDDFHVVRRIERSRTTTIFALDASGSSALHRLAEAKGAVELLLAECYVRRDSVAVLAFRGRDSELLLAPTRSLVRAKRALAELPGGGGTPLAAGLDAAAALADAVRRKGDTPIVVVLTDGRANVGRGGVPGREQAEADAFAAAYALRAGGTRAVLVDTAPKPQAQARAIAAAMQASYLPLPHAGAATLAAAVRRETAGPGGAARR